jgi:hypothetical protein
MTLLVQLCIHSLESNMDIKIHFLGIQRKYVLVSYKIKKSFNSLQNKLQNLEWEV